MTDSLPYNAHNGQLNAAISIYTSLFKILRKVVVLPNKLKGRAFKFVCEESRGQHVSTVMNCIVARFRQKDTRTIVSLFHGISTESYTLTTH